MKSCRWLRRSALPVMVSAIFLVASVPALADHIKEISGLGVDWRAGADPSVYATHQMAGYAGFNDSGVVVWSEQVGSYDQVFRFADGVGKQITNDNFNNRDPQINENGIIVWSRQNPDGSGAEIYYYGSDAYVYALTSDGRHNISPQINNNGDIVWESYATWTLNGQDILTDYRIPLFKSSDWTLHNLGDIGYENYSPQINDQGEVAWLGMKGSEYRVLSYYAGDTHLVATSNYAISDLRQNNKGQWVWQASDGQNSEIYFYDIVAGGQPLQISSQDNYNNLNPQINDSGAVVWQQWDGANYDICLYLPSGGPPANLTHQIVYDDYFDHYSPQINNRGDVAWIFETTDAYSYSDIGHNPYWNIQVYNYKDLTEREIEFHPVLHMITDNYLDGSLRLNERSQVMWQAHNNESLTVPSTDSLYVSTPETYYQFTFYYNKENNTEGDYYKGYFCDEMYAYTKGQTKDVSVTQDIWGTRSETGYYEITEVLPGLNNLDYSVYPYGGIFGNVFVLSYYDYQSDTTFTPVDVSGMRPSGIYGLGSEGGEIYELPQHYWEDGLGLPKNKLEAYYTHFGVECPSLSYTQLFYEANVLQSRYDFEYHYKSSDDYYAGYVYAPPGTFDVGMELVELYGKYWKPLEHGYYTILRQVDGFDVSTAYKFYVTSYYDSQYDSQMNPGQVDILPVSTSVNWVYGAVPSWFGEEAGYVFGRTTSGQFSINQEADLREKFRFATFADSQTDAMQEVLEYMFDVGSAVKTFQLSGAADQIAKLDPKPDFAVFLGDMGNWASDLTLTGALDINWQVWRDTVKPLYNYDLHTGIPIYPVVGNHEKYNISVMGDTMLKYAGRGYEKWEVYAWLFIVAPVAVILEDFIWQAALTLNFLSGMLDYETGVDAATEYSFESEDALTLQKAFVNQFVQGVKPGYNLPYYSLEYGNSYFTFLDSNYIDESLIDPIPNTKVDADAHIYKDYFSEVAGTQLDWLKQDAGQTSQFNKFAFAHKPAVCSGTLVDWDLWNFLDSQAFDIFYAADEHLYARAYVDNAFLNSLSSNTLDPNDPKNPNKTTHTITEIICGGLTDMFTPLKEVSQTWKDAQASGQSHVQTEWYHYVVTDVDSETTRTAAYVLVEVTKPVPLYDESGNPLSGPRITGYYGEPSEEYPNGFPIYEQYWSGDPDHVGDINYGEWRDAQYAVTQEIFDHWESVPFDYTDVTKPIPPRNTGGDSRYDFTCFYNNGNGDHYSGYFDAPTGYQGYKVGYRQEFTDENGQKGYYEINNQINLGNNSGGDGQVFVTSYYDQETGRALTPVGQGTAVGSNYLGSEFDFIINNAAGHRFGNFMGTFYEADQVLRFYFIHLYDSGDSYRGWVYDGGDKGYTVGQVINTNTEGQVPGHYEIVGEGPLVAGCQAGQVFVEYYYDSEIGERFTPMHAGSPVGADYLTSEVEYIIQDGKPEYRFGGGPGVTEIQEADGYYTYITQYNLSDGQRFYGTGTVGADFTLYFGTDNVQYNYYGLTGTLNREGNVTLDLYAYLFNSGELYWGVGVNDLGARTGYALLWPQSAPADWVLSGYAQTDGLFAFNDLRSTGENLKLYSGIGKCDLPFPVFQESLADVPGTSFTGACFLADYSSAAYDPDIFYARNYWGLVHALTLLEFEHSSYQDPPPITEGYWSFTYTKIDFNPVSVEDLSSIQGDSYTGTVIASADKGYYPGYMELTTDSNGQINGLYVITDASRVENPSLAGQVFVDIYHDIQSNRDFIPVHAGRVVGLNYLGSEQDYIIKAGVPEYAFGGGVEEADLAARYTYKFIYNDGKGDYYTGAVYASQDYGYFVGQTFSNHALDENQQHSYYQITGVSYLEDTSKYGQVSVDNYYDVEKRRAYRPTFTWGSNYLGSESGFIHLKHLKRHPEIFDPAKGFPHHIAKFYFGGGYYEADVKRDKKEKKEKEEATYTGLVATNVTDDLVHNQPVDQKENKGKKAK